MNKNMKEIDYHCADLSNLLSGKYETVQNEGWWIPSEWLEVASGIIRVDFCVTRFDLTYGYCENAADFMGAREEILTMYTLELTRFMFIWCALESLIEKINPDKVSKEDGIVNNICGYMKIHLGPDDLIDCYKMLVVDLEEILRNSDVNEQKIIKRFKAKDFVSPHGTGLYVVYKLRNLFVHGGLKFPKPDIENKSYSKYSKMVEISSRIILLSMQMILLAYYLEPGCHWGHENRDFKIEEILRCIHLTQ